MVELLILVNSNDHKSFYQSMSIVSEEKVNCLKLQNTHFFSLKIINPKDIHKNIQEISDQNHINIETQVNKFKYPGSIVTTNKLEAELDTWMLILPKPLAGWGSESGSIKTSS